MAVAHPLHLDKPCHLYAPQFHLLWDGDNGNDLLTKALVSTSEKCFIRPIQNESEKMLNYGIRTKNASGVMWSIITSEMLWIGIFIFLSISCCRVIHAVIQNLITMGKIGLFFKAFIYYKNVNRYIISLEKNSKTVFFFPWQNSLTSLCSILVVTFEAITTAIIGC